MNPRINRFVLAKAVGHWWNGFGGLAGLYFQSVCRPIGLDERPLDWLVF
jgi:hypothetical protein